MEYETTYVEREPRAGQVQSPPPEEPGRSRSRRRLRAVALAVISALVVVGLAAAGVLAFLRRSAPIEPLAQFADDGIPSNVSQLEAKSFGALLATADAPAVFLDSALASMLCGGTDLAGALLDARHRPLDELESEGLLDLFARPELQRRLSCGRAVRTAAQGAQLGALSFEDDGQTHQVLLIHAQAMSLPFPQHRFSGLGGFCEQAEGESECLPDGPAAVSQDGRWVFGKASAVEAYARAWTSTRRIDSTHVEIARALLGRVDGIGRAMIHVRPSTIPLGSACGAVAPHALLLDYSAKCFPQDLAQVEEAIEAKTRGFAFESSDPDREGAMRFTYTFVARDEDAAMELERDVADFHRDWLSHVDNHEDALVRLVRESDLAFRDHWETKLNAFVRALAAAEVERDGDTVYLRLATELTDAERRALRIESPELTRDIEAIGAIVEAVLGAQDVPADALTTLVGPELAEWMRLPRASSEDCAALRAKLGTLVANGVPPELFGSKFALEQRFAAEACEGAPLPPAVRTCLESAATLPAMQACPLPEGPFAAYWRRTLAGQWSTASVDAAPGFNYAQRREIEALKLEVVEGRVAVFLGQVFLGPLAVTASSTASARVRLPIGSPPVEPDVVPTENGDIRLTNLGGLELTMRRATFDRSLFAQAATEETER